MTIRESARSGNPHSKAPTVVLEQRKKKWPGIWHLDQLLISVQEIRIRAADGFIPLRPHGYPSLKHRFVAAWLVFTGKADAVIWPGDQ